MTQQVTVGQALVRFLAAQEVERDGARRRFFAGCWGIFGHGNVSGLGQALHQHADLLPFHQGRNEQAMVHIACGYARQSNRMSTFACTSSVGPGATNMVTGAALATINRLPVLLLPGDTFASRLPHPVLQQLEVPADGTASVNDAFRPISRYFDRISRPEQLIPAALEAVRVLTDPAETGAVTLALPEDVQTEAFDCPSPFLEPRVWALRRDPPPPDAVARAAQLVRGASRPLIVAGGGVIYSEATDQLRHLAVRTGIPVCETQAGRGSLASEHSLALGAIGVTGTAAANRLAREADLVIGIGTRWSDFTTASKTIFADPGVRFVNVNVAAFDAAKHSGLAIVADAREAIVALEEALSGHRVDSSWEERAVAEAREFSAEVARVCADDGATPMRQAAVIGAVNDVAAEDGIVVCAAGSMPGDLHKLWRSRHPKSYHVEYGYSCMGYEIPGGIGVKLAAPEAEVFVLVGDGSYLMLPGEVVSAVAEGIKVIVVLVDNQGYSSIGALSREVGSAGFGTHYRPGRGGDQPLDADSGTEPVGDPGRLPIDLGASAEALGLKLHRARSIAELRRALSAARDEQAGPVAIHVEVDRYAGVPSYESWWDVPVAEVSEQSRVRAARERYERDRARQRRYLEAP